MFVCSWHFENVLRWEAGAFFFCCVFLFLCCKNNKKSKKQKKMKKKCKKICIYQKNVVPLHQISKQGDRKHQKRNKKSY